MKEKRRVLISQLQAFWRPRSWITPQKRHTGPDLYLALAIAEQIRTRRDRNSGEHAHSPSSSRRATGMAPAPRGQGTEDSRLVLLKGLLVCAGGCNSAHGIITSVWKKRKEKFRARIRRRGNGHSSMPCDITSLRTSASPSAIICTIAHRRLGSVERDYFQR
ncbi:hypothetical protein ACQKWADRAFT_90036 [Trichoderma austrokoningii]